MAKYKRIWRLNTDNRWVTYHYAVFRPENSDIVLSPTGKNFVNLVNSYPNTWERASNWPFMNHTTGDGAPLSYVYKNGTQHYAPSHHTSRAWAFAVLDANNNLRVVEANPATGPASASNDSVEKMKATYNASTVSQCKWGVSVGPLPIGGAPLSEWPPTQRDYPDPYDNDTSSRMNLGIGLLSDGLVLHLVNIDGYCSKQDLHNVAKEFNPVWFQMFDGGGSVGLIDKNESSTNMGFNSRLMRVGFIIRSTEEIPAQHVKSDCIVPPGYVGDTPCG